MWNVISVDVLGGEAAIRVKKRWSTLHPDGITARHIRPSADECSAMVKVIFELAVFDDTGGDDDDGDHE